MTSIGNRCFYECSSLTSVQLPSTLLCIGDYAFSSNNDDRAKITMKQVEVPKNCQIGKHAFEDDCKVILK